MAATVLGTTLFFVGVESICAEVGSAERLRFSDKGRGVVDVEFIGRDDTVSVTTAVVEDAALTTAAGDLDGAAVLAAVPGSDILFSSVAIEAAADALVWAGLEKTVALAKVDAGVVDASFSSGAAMPAAVAATPGVGDFVTDASFSAFASTLAVCACRSTGDFFTEPPDYDNHSHK